MTATATAVNQADVLVYGGGTLYIVQALTQAAKDWVAEHVSEERTSWGPNGFAVEHRFIGDLLNGMEADGLVVRS